MFHCLCGVLFIIIFFPWSLTWCRRTGNCWNADSSENITFPHCFSVQCSYLKTNSNGFFFIFCDKLLFEAGLCYFSPNSSTNLRDSPLTHISAFRKQNRLFEECETIHLITWSSLGGCFSRMITSLSVKKSTVQLVPSYCIVNRRLATANSNRNIMFCVPFYTYCHYLSSLNVRKCLFFFFCLFSGKLAIQC